MANSRLERQGLPCGQLGGENVLGLPYVENTRFVSFKLQVISMNCAMVFGFAILIPPEIHAFSANVIARWTRYRGRICQIKLAGGRYAQLGQIGILSGSMQYFVHRS